MEDFTLNTGASMPCLAFGSGTVLFNRDGAEGVDAGKAELLRTAIDAGWRHLDTAQVYGTEQDLGAALASVSSRRQELFVTTKIGRDYADVAGTLEASLRKLGLSYVDAFLLHEPYHIVAAGGKEALWKSWAAMEACMTSGRTRAIGVSNFTVEHLQMLLEGARVKPAVNQVEFSPYMQQAELREYCAGEGIKLTAYGVLNPLTRNLPGPLDAGLDGLAAKYGAEKETILMRWSLALGIAVVTITRREQKCRAWLREVERVELSADDVELICRLGDETAKSSEVVPRMLSYMRAKGLSV